MVKTVKTQCIASQHKTEEKKIPNLRFPGFKGEWCEKKIEEIFTVKAGGDIYSEHVSEKKTETFKYPIYANAEKKKGLYGYSDQFKVSKPSVTVAGRGVNIGIAHARDHKFYPIVRLLVLTPKQERSISFYEYAINQFKIFVESTGVPQLTGPQISYYRITSPPLPEQQKIASFLSAVDQKIQQLTRKKEVLELYKKGVMQKIFSQEIRFKPDVAGFDSAQPAGEGQVVEQNRVVERSRNYPDWEEERLGDIGATYNGLNGKTADDFGEGVPYVTYKQIFDNSKVDITKFDYVRIVPGEKQSKVEYGDVFFTTSSETRLEVGFASVLLDEIEELYLNSFCFGYRINSHDEFFPKFARYLFRSEEFRRKIVKLGQGSTRYNMSKNEMKKLTIQIPVNEEQKKIAEFLLKIDNKIAYISTQINQTKQFKKGLLQQMFV